MSEYVYTGLGVDVVGGVLDAKAIATAAKAKAQAWVSKTFGKTGNTVANFAAEYAYAEGTKFMADVMNNAGVKRALDVLGASGKLAYSVDDLVGLARKGPPKDLAGMFAWRDGVDKALNNLVVLAESLGLPKEVAREVSGWIGVGTGCSSAIAGGATVGGWGAVAGAAVCLGMIAAKLADYFKPQPAEQIRHRGCPTCPPVAFTPSSLSLRTIKVDAVHLAGALAGWYNIESVASIYKQLNVTFSGRFGAAPYPEFTPNGSEPPRFDATGMTPAVDPWAVLTILDFEHGVSDVNDPLMNTRAGLFALLRVMLPLESRAACCPPGGHIGVLDTTHWLGNHYFDGHDVSAAAIRVAAAIGRAAIAQTGEPILICRTGQTGAWTPGTGGCERAVDGEIFTTYMPGGMPDRLSANLAPFIRFDELINLFVAIGERERTEGVLGDRLTEFAQRLPVRWYYANDANRKPYSPTYWTRLWHGDSFSWAEEQIVQLRRLVLSGDAEACRQFAYLRVIAAFSYLVTMYHWTYRVPQVAVDPIAELRQETDPAARYLQSPVDPRYYNRGNERLAGTERAITIEQSSVSWDGCASIEVPKIGQVPGIITGLVGAPANDAVGVAAGMDGRVLYQNILNREAQYRDLMDRAYRAAIDDVIAQQSWSPAPTAWTQEGGTVFATGTGGVVQIAKPQQHTVTSMSKAQINPAFLKLLAAGLVQVKGQINPTFQANCEKSGGLTTLVDGYQKCHPTTETRIALEAKCRAVGGTPAWVETPFGPQLQCRPPQADTTGGLGSIAVLAGAALLFSFLR